MSDVIVLICWVIVFRVDEFTIPDVWGRTMIDLRGEMKPRGRKRDSPIEDLSWYTFIPLAIYTYFFERRSIWGPPDEPDGTTFLGCRNRSFRPYLPRSENL